MKTKDINSEREAKFTAMRRGFEERLPRSAEKVVVHGDRMTIAGIHDRLVAIGEAHEAVRRAKAKYEEAVRTLRSTEAEDDHFHAGLERLVRQLVGRNKVRLSYFGL